MSDAWIQSWQLESTDEKKATIENFYPKKSIPKICRKFPKFLATKFPKISKRKISNLLQPIFCIFLQFFPDPGSNVVRRGKWSWCLNSLSLYKNF